MDQPRRLVALTAPMHAQAMQRLAEFAEICVASTPAPDHVRRALDGASALIVRNPVPAQAIAGVTTLRVIVRHGIGLDFVPLETASQAGIVVANAPDANVQSVVEHVLGCMFAMVRGLHLQNAELRRGNWAIRNGAWSELAGKTLGIVGLGRIGRRLAAAAEALNMKVVAHDPVASGDGVPLLSLEELVAVADVISLHVPLTAATTGMIDATLLRRMKRSTFLINAARGPIVVERDLADALAARHIAGAAVDVFVEEPIGVDHPFLALDNILLTPHSAALTEESMLRMGLESVDEVHRVFAGREPRNFVNRQEVMNRMSLRP
jgi:D-3-phosphoglycerate dehydrogenase